MTWVWGILLFIVIVLLLAMVAPVQIEVHYKREGKDDRLHLGVRALFGLLRLGYDIPTVSLMERGSAIMLKKDPAKQMPASKKGVVTLTVEKIEKIFRQIRVIRRRFAKFKRALRKLTRTFHITLFHWDTMFGTGDAARTGYMTGLAWSVKGMVSSYLYRYMSADKRLRYNVRPHFRAKGFRTELRCIIRFCPGKAMIAVVHLVFLWLKERIKWRSIRFKA